MAEEIRDHLAERIAKRRAERALEDERLAAGLPAALPATGGMADPKDRPDPEFEKALAEAIQAIAAGDNPIKIARLLSAILVGGVKRKAVLERLGKSDAWLSRRLGLLNADKDVQRLIETGELSEREYYNNRPNINQGIRGRGAALRYQRMPTITIGIEAARAIAAILQDLAIQQGAAPIRLDANTSKKDLTGILNQRAGEIRGMLKS